MSFDEAPNEVGLFVGGEVTDRLMKTVHTLYRHRWEIQRALSYSNYAFMFDDVVQRVLSGNATMYPLDTSVVIMECTQYPQFKVYHGFIAAGDLDEIMGLQPTLEADAKKLGCEYLTLSGRHGWVRALKRNGWQHTLSHLSLRLSNE